MSFPYVVGLAYGRDKKFTSTKYHPLGTKGETPDGRVFYYAQAGSPALVGGTIIQSKAAEGSDAAAKTNLLPAVSGDKTAIGTGSNIPTGSASIGVVWVTAHASGEYTDGYMTVDTPAGSGMYRIVGDDATGSSNTVTVIRLHPQDTIQDTALTTASRLSFHHNPYASVIVAPTTLTNVVVGVAPVAVTAANYFWLQTYGPASVRYNDLISAVVGETLMAGVGATAGDAVGVPKSTNTESSVDAGATVSGQQLTNAAPRIGTVLDGIPADDKLLQVMLTIRA